MTQQDCEGLQAQDGGPVLALRGRGDQPVLLGELELLLPGSTLVETSSVSFFMSFFCASSELDVFQMVLMVAALGLLAASALYWLAVCYSRSRWETVC